MNDSEIDERAIDELVLEQAHKINQSGVVRQFAFLLTQGVTIEEIQNALSRHSPGSARDRNLRAVDKGFISSSPTAD